MRKLLPTMLSPLILLALAARAKSDGPPAIGTKAPAFHLNAIDGKECSLAEATAEGPVVLVVLRGYPGYQCPICTRQVGDLLRRADQLAQAEARVLLVYPGPSDQLQERAEEFLGGQTLPEHFTLLLDPAYTFTNAYGLRWEAPRETAYPATFVIGGDGVVRYSKISESHGDRASSDEILKAIRLLEDGVKTRKE